MGCDIHPHIEVRKNGKWEYFDWRKEFQNGTYDDGEPKYDWNKMFESPLYIHRNYNLFAILANVRNGRGFAGCLTGMGFNPISEPRDLPNDVTEYVKSESDKYNGDGHSHSWLLLSELLNYDYEQTTTLFGFFSEEQYIAQKDGVKNSYCGGVDGGRVEKVCSDLMDKIISGEVQRDPEKHYYVQLAWKETYQESIGKQWFDTLEYMKSLGNPDDVRLVFWFDN